MPSADISVVIPTYNRVTLLPRAIESALSQQLPVREVIVADDGSTDRTLPMLRDWAAVEPRLSVIECPHGGANRARNAGIAEARGQWIAFLDSDDHWLPRKLSAQISALDASPECVASFTGLTMRGADGELRFTPRHAPSLLDLRCSNVLSSTSSALIRADTLRAVGGFDPLLPSCQDWDLWFRLRQVGPFAVVQEALTIIDTGPHLRITTDKPRVREGHAIIFRRMREGVPPGRDLRRIDATHKLVMSGLERRVGNHEVALKHAATSLLHYPSKWGARAVIEALREMARHKAANGWRSPARDTI